MKELYFVQVFVGSESHFEEYYSEKEIEIIMKFFADIKKHDVASYDIPLIEFRKKNQWVAYRKEGMDCILHGKIIRECSYGYCVKRKNAYKDFIRFEDIIEFFDNKEECYKVR